MSLRQIILCILMTIVIVPARGQSSAGSSIVSRTVLSSDTASAHKGSVPLCLTIQAQEISSRDSLNIPVYLVDGVEVQSLDSISPDDVVDIKVFKDEEVKKLFYPRVGGVVYITTKSKKFLTPVIKRYKENVEANKKRKKEGQIYIR